MKAEAINNLEIRGMTEDGDDVLRDVIYLVITGDNGARWRGPEIGFLGLTITQEEVALKVAILQYALNECGLDPRAAWEPWFPVYGSDAYIDSNQEELDRWVERQNDEGRPRPYIPAR